MVHWNFVLYTEGKASSELLHQSNHSAFELCQILCKPGQRAFIVEAAAPQVEQGAMLTGTRCPDRSRAGANNKPRRRRAERRAGTDGGRKMEERRRPEKIWE